jgi:hypothetical protein
MFIRVCGTIAALMILSSQVIAQPVSSADVNIVSVTATSAPNETFVCSVEVNNKNDDDAWGTTLIVLLPLQVKNVIRMSVVPGPTRCIRGPSRGGFTEYVTCDLGHLPVESSGKPLRTIKITTSASTAGPSYPPTCGAFVYSQVGDIDKANNYGWSH